MPEVSYQNAEDEGSERVEFDLPCLRCGYNLRTLRVSGVCPECGWKTRRSLDVVPNAGALGRLVIARRFVLFLAWLPIVALATLLVAAPIGSELGFQFFWYLAPALGGVSAVLVLRRLRESSPRGIHWHGWISFAVLLVAWLYDSMDPDQLLFAMSPWVVAEGLVWMTAVSLAMAVAGEAVRLSRRLEWRKVAWSGRIFLALAWLAILGMSIPLVVEPDSDDQLVAFPYVFFAGVLAAINALICFGLMLLRFAACLRPAALAARRQP